LGGRNLVCALSAFFPSFSQICLLFFLLSKIEMDKNRSRVGLCEKNHRKKKSRVSKNNDNRPCAGVPVPWFGALLLLPTYSQWTWAVYYVLRKAALPSFLSVHPHKGAEPTGSTRRNNGRACCLESLRCTLTVVASLSLAACTICCQGKDAKNALRDKGFNNIRFMETRKGKSRNPAL
jgi:hypothetical protein